MYLSRAPKNNDYSFFYTNLSFRNLISEEINFFKVKIVNLKRSVPTSLQEGSECSIYNHLIAEILSDLNPSILLQHFQN